MLHTDIGDCMRVRTQMSTQLCAHPNIRLFLTQRSSFAATLLKKAKSVTLKLIDPQTISVRKKVTVMNQLQNKISVTVIILAAMAPSTACVAVTLGASSTFTSSIRLSTVHG